MAVAACPTIDPTLMPGPVSPAPSDAEPHATPGPQVPASFLAAFGLAIDAAAQAEQQPASSARAGSRLASLSQVPEARPEIREQTAVSAVPDPGTAPDAAENEVLPPVKERPDWAQPSACGRPAVIAQVPVAPPAVPAQTSVAAGPDPGTAPDATYAGIFPPVTEAAEGEQARVLARRTSTETGSERPPGPGQAPPAGNSALYAHAFPAGQGAIPDPELPPESSGQGRPAGADFDKTFFQSPGPAPESSDISEGVYETGRSVNAEVASEVAECSPGGGKVLRLGQDPEACGEGLVEAAAAEPPQKAADTTADAGPETTGSNAAPRYLPDGLPTTETRIDSIRTMPDRPPLPQLSTVVKAASEVPMAWKSILWVAGTVGPMESPGLKEGFQNPARSGLPHLQLLADRLPVAERIGEAWAGLFRPGLLMESAPHAPANAHPDARAIDTGALTQEDTFPLTPAASRPDQATDAFTRAAAGSPQPPIQDSASQTPVSSPSGRGPGSYSFVSELANPPSGGSIFADSAASGNAGAAEHFSLQGRPAGTPVVTQPSSSLAFANADDLYLRLAEQMHLQVREGKSSVRIQLKPDALGRLEIKAESTAAGLTATIVADTHGVKAFLEQNLHTLYRTLQDMGLKVDRILVTEDGSQHHAPGQSNDGDARPGQNRSYRDGSPSWLPGDPAERTEPLPVAPAIPGYWMPHSTFHAVA